MRELEKQVLSHKDEIIDFLSRLIAVPSVRGEASKGAPYGEDCKRALEVALEEGRKLGFTVKNIENKVGYIEYGEGEEYAAAVVHSDIVPAGDGWSSDPFTAEIRDGKLYGRGACDDKGPLAAALYGMLAIKELGIKGRKFRLIVGSDEECGMSDMECYNANEPLPKFAFSPDSAYPIYNREMGIMNTVMELDNSDGVVERFDCGIAFNVVPSVAKATVMADNFTELKALADNEFGGEYPITVEKDGDKIIVTATGKSAHASVSNEGFNAGLNLCRLLRKCYGKAAGKAINFIADTFELDTDGLHAGIACSDEESGPLHMNVGKIYGDKTITVGIDCRCPISVDYNDIFAILKEKAESAGFTASLHHAMAPLYVPADAPLISVLSKAYEEATGEKAKLCLTGGGTYSRAFPNVCVSFGMEFEGGENCCYHQADEHILLDEFWRHTYICACAIKEMILFEGE